MYMEYSAMKILIAGSRDYTNYEEAVEFIKRSIQQLAVSKGMIILSGGCTGVDRLGERFAKENGFQTEIFPAQWSKFGKAAGIFRNKDMADNADAVICFWNGKSKGTKSLIDYAKATKKPLFM